MNYDLITQSVAAIIGNVDYAVSNMANIAAILLDNMEDIN